MSEATATDSIYTLMARVMGEVRAVGKDGQYAGGASGSFKFRGIDAVINAVGPAFRKWGAVGPAFRDHGIVTLPELLTLNAETVKSSKDKPMRLTTVKVRYTFVGPAGDKVETTVPGEAWDSEDKGSSKAMSVAYRTFLLQSLCLPTDEPDPDSEVYEQQGTPLDAARKKLDQKMQDLKLNPDAVPARNAQDYEGRDPRTDTDLARVLEFTESLGK